MTFQRAFGFQKLKLDGFRGADDTIFGQWRDASLEEETADEKAEPAVQPKDGPQLAARGSYFLKFKKLSSGTRLLALYRVAHVLILRAEEIAQQEQKLFKAQLDSLVSMGFAKEVGFSLLA